MKPDVSECHFKELTHSLHLTRRDHDIIRFGLLENQPHCLDVFLRVSPVTSGVQVTQIEFVLQTGLDPCNGPRDLTGHERLAAPWRLVIEKNPVTGMEAV